MKLLLDTHAFIWWDENPSKLGAAARRACSDPGNDLILSTASVWEIQLKRMIGKLTLARPLRPLLEDQARQNGLEISPIQVEHILRPAPLEVEAHRPHPAPVQRQNLTI